MSKSALLKMLAASMEADDDGVMPSFEEQNSKISAFLLASAHAQSLKVGDVVTRNEFGTEKYKFPKEDQTARIVSVFSYPIADEDGQVTHGELAIVHKGGLLRPYAVDFRYYQKAE